MLLTPTRPRTACCQTACSRAGTLRVYADTMQFEEDQVARALGDVTNAGARALPLVDLPLSMLQGVQPDGETALVLTIESFVGELAVRCTFGADGAANCADLAARFAKQQGGTDAASADPDVLRRNTAAAEDVAWLCMDDDEEEEVVEDDGMAMDTVEEGDEEEEEDEEEAVVVEEAAAPVAAVPVAAAPVAAAPVAAEEQQEEVQVQGQGLETAHHQQAPDCAMPSTPDAAVEGYQLNASSEFLPKADEVEVTGSDHHHHPADEQLAGTSGGSPAPAAPCARTAQLSATMPSTNPFSPSYSAEVEERVAKQVLRAARGSFASSEEMLEDLAEFRDSDASNCEEDSEDELESSGEDDPMRKTIRPSQAASTALDTLGEEEGEEEQEEEEEEEEQEEQEEEEEQSAVEFVASTPEVQDEAAVEASGETQRVARGSFASSEEMMEDLAEFRDCDTSNSEDEEEEHAQNETSASSEVAASGTLVPALPSPSGDEEEEEEVVVGPSPSKKRAARGSFASSEEMLDDLAEFRDSDTSNCEEGGLEAALDASSGECGVDDAGGESCHSIEVEQAGHLIPTTAAEQSGDDDDGGGGDGSGSSSGSGDDDDSMELTGEIPPLSSLSRADASPLGQVKGRAGARKSMAGADDLAELYEMRDELSDSDADESEAPTTNDVDVSAENIGAAAPSMTNDCATPEPASPAPSGLLAEQSSPTSPETAEDDAAAVAAVTPEAHHADAASVDAAVVVAAPELQSLATPPCVAPATSSKHERAAQLVKTLRASREAREKRAALVALAATEPSCETDAAPDYTESARVNEYLRMDPTSSEAIDLARAIFEATGYAVGTMRASTGPPTLADKRALVNTLLSPAMQVMEKDGKREKKLFEKLTGARVGKDADGDCKYSDIASGKVIAGKEYAQRFQHLVVEHTEADAGQERLWTKWEAALNEYRSSAGQ